MLREATEVVIALSAMYLGIWVGPEAHLKQLDAPTRKFTRVAFPLVRT